MADRSLKSTIQVDMDTSGVVRGVAATNRELQRMNRSAATTATATSLSASISVAQAGFSVLQSVLGVITGRIEELNAAAFKYSPEAIDAKADLNAAKIVAEQRTGSLFGAGAAAQVREQQMRLEERMRREETMAPDIAAGSAFFSSLLETTKAVGGAVLDQFLANVGNPESNRTMTQAAFEAAGMPQFLSGEGFSQGGSAQGMFYDEAGLMQRQTRALESMDRKLGGT